MRRRLLRGAFFALLLLFPLAILAQTSNPTPAPPPRNDDIEEKLQDQSAPASTDAVVTLSGEVDTPDLPAIAVGLIDSETYLRMRDEHIRFLRGLMDKLFDPRSRGQAIRQMKEQERQLRQGQQNGNGAGNSANNGTGSGSTGPNTAASLSPVSGPAWSPLGPAPIPNGQTTSISLPVSGRVTSIAVHPTNENIVYVGTAQGGLYRSLDGGTTWTALMDDSLSLAVGSVAIDPLDPTTIFVGTGEGNLSADSFFGVGLYIIKHADTTPNVLGPFNLDGSANDVFTGRSITRVLVSPTDDNIVFVSTTSGIGGISADSIPSVISGNLPSRGLYRSTNAMSGSPTFTKITVQPANGGNRGITDIAFDPANPNVLLAGVNGFASATVTNDGGIWRTTNALAPTPTFTNQQPVGTATATIQIKMASNAVGGVTTVLAATGETSSVVSGSTCGAPGMVRRSLDGGITFDKGIAQTQAFCNTQCFYDMAPAMDPTNSSIIYLGGSANANTNPPRADCKAVVLSKATDGLTFNRIDTGLHADTHAVAVAPSNPSVVYFGSDGGVWRSSNSGTSWQSINTVGFNATQFQSIALHPSDRNFSIGGTQDNGTPWLHPDTTWTRADFGDGGFALIDQNAADTTNVTMYHTYFNQTNNLIGYARVTTTTNAHDNGWAFFGCNGTTANNGFRCADTVLFYAPMALGPGTPNTLYFGTDRLYRSVNQGTTMTLVSQGPFVSGSPVSAIGISPQNDNVRIVGIRNGKVFATTTGANPLTDVTNAGFPAKYVARAVIDPNNSNTAYVSFAGFGIVGKQVWKTTNLAGGAATWSAAAAGLPDAPVDAFAVDPVNSQVLYAGTDIGVYISRDGGGSWLPYGTGLPRVAVFDLKVQNPNRLIRIATHGRGAWEIAAAKSPAVVTVAPSVNTATYGDNVTFTATVSAGGVLATPSGNVTFTDGIQTLGTASLDGSLHATLSTSLLSAGPHSIVATFNGDTIFDVSPSTGANVNINPAGLTVNVDSATRQYGQANPVFTGTVNGIKNGDNITATYSSATDPTTAVGTYPIVATLHDPDSKLGNYTVTLNNGTLTITQAPLTVSANNKTRPYGQPNPPLDGTLVGVLNGDNITATFSTVATPTSPVGTYAIVPTLLDPTSKLGNYSVTSNNGTLTITPVGLMITADDKTKVLDSPNPAFTATYSGFQNGDTPASLTGVLTCATTAVTNSPVGSYPITCSGQSSSNYTITYVPGTLSIIFNPTGLVDGEPGHQVLAPLAADGSSVFNAGRTVPIKFRVGDVNGVSIGTPGTVTSFRIIDIIAGTVATPVDLPVTSTSADTAFRYDPTSQQWIFNLSTAGLSAGSTYVFRIGLSDGSHIDFQFGLR
jgi:MBG domain (YGX type)/Bacterial Ig-like domain (group 3)